MLNSIIGISSMDYPSQCSVACKNTDPIPTTPSKINIPECLFSFVLLQYLNPNILINVINNDDHVL